MAAAAATRQAWKGRLRISLVEIPVKMWSAHTDGDSVSFTTLHPACGSKTSGKKWCPHCNEEVPYGDAAKAYEFAPGQLVPVDDAEIDALKVDSTKVITITHIVGAAELDPVYTDKTYFMSPDGGGNAFSVMLAALAGKAAIGKIVMQSREIPVAVTPRGKGFLVTTLHPASEVRRVEDIADLALVRPVAEGQELALAKQLVATFPAQIDLTAFRDEYSEALRAMLAAKAAGDAVSTTPSEARPSSSASLMDLLAASVAAVAA
ncbi:MAG: hypothetical protein MUF54_01540 [Polyangiaceae bacterium]|jgi:DNA end-binding protein Ku|nr:hypothetical protein [Polyangiaceae bacterium]